MSIEVTTQEMFHELGQLHMANETLKRQVNSLTATNKQLVAALQQYAPKTAVVNDALPEKSE